jgi:hypothetical protein
MNHRSDPRPDQLRSRHAGDESASRHPDDMNLASRSWAGRALALPDIFRRAAKSRCPGRPHALEASAISVLEPGDRALVVVAGVFGSLMREIMTRAGAEVTEHTVEWGHTLDLARLEKDVERVKPKVVSVVHNETSTGTTYPAAEVARIVKRHGALFMLDTVSSLAGLDVRTDEWGVDLNMTGSQKCLAAPLGMAIVSVSPAAWEAMGSARRNRPRAHHLLLWKDGGCPSREEQGPGGAPRASRVDPAHLTAAMREAVRLILAEGSAPLPASPGGGGGRAREEGAGSGDVPDPVVVSTPSRACGPAGCHPTRWWRACGTSTAS